MSIFKVRSTPQNPQQKVQLNCICRMPIVYSLRIKSYEYYLLEKETLPYTTNNETKNEVLFLPPKSKNRSVYVKDW